MSLLASVQKTAIYDSKVKLFLKSGISRQLSKFECENSAIDVVVKFFMKNIPQANRTCGFDHR